MNAEELIRDAVLRVGEVVAVRGRTVTVEVDKRKNQTDLMFNGEIVKNILVDSYVEIRKGFLSLIGKVDGEEIKEEPASYKDDKDESAIKIRRLLSVSLVGFIDSDNVFEGGTKELPLIGNEAFVVSAEKIKTIHKLVEGDELSITIAETSEGIDIEFPVDGLFNGHIAIFGNTGSGKSNTLAHLYQELIHALSRRDCVGFKENTRFLLFDFNGEFAPKDKKCIITKNKTVYVPSADPRIRQRVPLRKSELLNHETLSILTDASQKTQRPFLRRALSLYDDLETDEHASCILKRYVKRILAMSEKQRAYQLLGAMRDVLGLDNLEDRYEWIYARTSPGFKVHLSTGGEIRVEGNEKHEGIERLRVYDFAKTYRLPRNIIDRFIAIVRISLIKDLYDNVVQYEHISPLMGRLIGRAKDIKNSFYVNESENCIWDEHNFIVVNLNNAETAVKKLVPLVITKVLYEAHKPDRGKKTLNIIVDEAHQILSEESSREEENWKDYRLETFEEVIKEGRKFGVFVTIASQRPYDISRTISSQAHNYFIHRLVNKNDLESVSKAVSYIDRVTEESIPTLPTGTCIFSGVASNMPLKLNINELDNEQKPWSKTLEFKTVVKSASQNSDND